jgi:zinc transport system substrate-binding protein
MSKFYLTLPIFLALAAPTLAAPKVVTSIVPLHSLVATVMDGVGEPELLLQGINSEHQASYSPQQISTLTHADVVFIIGDNLEVKLGEISGSETVNGKAFVKLIETPHLTTHPIRQGGTWEVDDHAVGTIDPHIWLDPENARTMTLAIAATLAKMDAGNAAIYMANATKQITALDALEAEIKTTLLPVKDKPFIVFHDAYQYFDRRFSMNAVGSISDFSGTSPSAQRLEEIRNKIKSSNAVCVFREPQFSDAAIVAVTEDSQAKLGVLDPIGAALTPGKAAYAELLRAIAKNLSACLSN